MGNPHYWSRQKKFTRTEPALTLHFTHHPGDVIIRVALANRPAHDLIVAPPGSSDQALFLLVRDYVRDLTRTEAKQLRIGSPIPAFQKRRTS